MSACEHFVVLYRIESIMTALDQPLGFTCWAENTEHAEEQCLNAYPDADIVWVWAGPEQDAYLAALENYYDLAPDTLDI